MRKGFSLVEALVALALFQIAMLALAAASIVAARDLGSAALRARATSIAAQRVEELRLRACTAAPEAGTRGLAGGYRESWRSAPNGRLRAVSDSISFLLPTGRESFVTARDEVLCDP